jgi:hypothetical protein
MGPLAEFFGQIDWKEIIAAVSAIAFLLFALAALGAVWRIKAIVEALREFQRSKSELVGLLDAIDRLESMTPKLNILVSDIQEDISELARSKPPEQEATPEAASDYAKEPTAAAALDGVSKWQEINTIWRVVRDEIEDKISKLDGRSRRRYNNLYRHNYSEIIDMLLADGKLAQAQADAAKQMNQFLLAWKPKRNKSEITEEDIKEFEEWKKVFDGASAQASS